MMPDIPGRWCVAAACATGLGVVLPPIVVGVVAAVATIGAVRARRWPIGVATLCGFAVLGTISALVADERVGAIADADVPTGRVVMRAAIREDPIPASGWMAVGRPIDIDGTPWPGPPIGLGPLPPDVAAGDVVVAEGVLRPRLHRLRNDLVAGTLHVDELVDVRRAGGPFFAVGNRLRERVRSAFGTGDVGDALVTGLLIGDTEWLPETVMEDLRRAGLAHFVAVSGSNVALFLGAWWLVGAPLAIRPRPRAVVGILGLIVFVVVTRWEPSVIRASVMAAVPLVGGLVGVPVGPWTALGTAVTLVLLVSADLIFSVGFQLSVAATAGVLLGVASVRDRTPRWVWVPLGATVGAQAAVAPLILIVFGTIPLASPIANVVAAPIVTAVSAVGIARIVLPVPLIGSVARIGADLVLQVAEIAADGPQLDMVGAIVAGAVGAAVVRRGLRPIGLAGVAIALLATSNGPAPWPSVPTLVALDVDQGDALVLQDPSGRVALVDGGRSPAVLDRALRRRGIDRIDLLVVSHGDADHAGGLEELVAFGDVGEIWIPDHIDDPALDRITGMAIDRGVPIRRIGAGHRARIGSIRLEVLGPGRRYLADNDASIVIVASAGRTALLPGDIEAVAQADLPPLRPDILVVPHHGAATSDPAWLRRTVGTVAVLSYGPNAFGHPHPEVVDVLEDAGAIIHHTHLDGDIVLPLG